MSVSSGEMPPPMMPPPAYAPMPAKRPLGVSILAILWGLLGFGLIVGGIAILAFSGVGGIMGYGMLAALGAGLGAIVLLVGLLTMASAIGLWRMRSWAWWLAIIVGAISIVIDGLTYNWLGLAIALIILIYLVVVRDKFGIGARPAGM